jgi:hypothetical protein
VGSRTEADAVADVERWFSRLRTATYKVTSAYDRKYNCAAFAAGQTDTWWEPAAPDGYWPPGVPSEYTVDAYAAAYRSIGFAECDTDTSEDGFEKIAIYGDDGDFVHAARQLRSGVWTSKLGRAEDIEHETLQQLEGNGQWEYRFVVKLMKRRWATNEDA